MRKLLLQLAILSIILALHTPYTQAQTFSEIVKAVASDRATKDKFGISVSISGDYAIVGAYNEDEDAAGGNTVSNAGAAYIFKKDEGGTDNWAQIQKIVASDRASTDNFGISVSISGDYAIVGAYFEDEDAAGSNAASNTGSAYIFKKDEGGTDNWGQIQKIVASDRAIEDYFGYSVSIFGDYAIVGAYLENEDAAGGNTASNTGSAYIFKRDEGGTDNWGQIQKIVASDRTISDHFGNSVSISGDYAIVGASLEDEDVAGGSTAYTAGSAYIFKRDEGGTDNWGQIQKIVASDRASEDYFGHSVSISGDYAIVGARLEDEDAAGGNTATSAGSAYIFKSSAALPVELTYFKGQATATGAYLEWQTANEENNKGFNIQHSLDGENWETIDFVQGHGTIQEVQDYTYTDETPPAGINYYRLKQVDFDGQFEYSNIVNVHYEAESTNDELSVFPNPISDELNIINGEGIATIYNILGQPVKQFTVNSRQFAMNTGDLPKGQYILHIFRQNGMVVTRQFVK